MSQQPAIELRSGNIWINWTPGTLTFDLHIDSGDPITVVIPTVDREGMLHGLDEMRYVLQDQDYEGLRMKVVEEPRIPQTTQDFGFRFYL